MTQGAPHPLELAIAVAREAGSLIASRFGREQRVELKGAIDLVTESDRASERLIVDRIAAAFPEHTILAEEGQGRFRGGGARWLVDPLDGTTNFAHGYPCFAVSIALELDGQLECGVVHDPIRGETYAAQRGRGATLDGAPIRVSSATELDHSLLVTGFAYGVRDDPEPTLALLRGFLLAAQGLRRDGSAALDLCYVAAGRFDGFWELGLKPWDIAAGTLILREAGGKATRLDGGDLELTSGSLLATNGRLHDEMLAIAAQAAATQK